MYVCEQRAVMPFSYVALSACYTDAYCQARACRCVLRYVGILTEGEE